MIRSTRIYSLHRNLKEYSAGRIETVAEKAKIRSDATCLTGISETGSPRTACTAKLQTSLQGCLQLGEFGHENALGGFDSIRDHGKKLALS